MGKRPAFFSDGSGSSFLNLEEGSNLVLELGIECALMVRSPIFLGQIDCGGGDGEDDQHHRQQQLGPEG